MKVELLHGDCLHMLKWLDDNSVHAVVTDPPYGLRFMGKKWDHSVPSVEIWKEVMRVLRPGGHLLSFGGTRTYHRMVVNIEDAGFEIRDQIQWLYGSGFPKSQNVAIQIDKQAGAIGHRGKAIPVAGRGARADIQEGSGWNESNTVSHKPVVDSAKQWQGWGTALKPANEPICLARKPLDKGLTVAQNVMKWGTGALNIDAGRVGTALIQGGRAGRHDKSNFNVSIGEKPPMHEDRWPANVIFDEEAAAMLDEQSGVLKSGALKPYTAVNTSNTSMAYDGDKTWTGESNTGGASRFFYVAKASKSERNRGLEGMPKKTLATSTGQTRPGSPARLGADPHAVQSPVANHHPTVKPIKLMEYLIKLVTPPGGIVLDPFCGSGSTGVAAKSLGFDFIGIEREAEYIKIAKKRIEGSNEKK